MQQNLSCVYSFITVSYLREKSVGLGLTLLNFRFHFFWNVMLYRWVSRFPTFQNNVHVSTFIFKGKGVQKGQIKAGDRWRYIGLVVWFLKVKKDSREGGYIRIDKTM